MGEQVVAFDSGHLQERGTDVALFDYAHFNETLLGNRSLIFAPARSDLSCLNRFRSRFSVFLYRDREDLERSLRGVDLYYRQVYGNQPADPLPRAPGCRVGVHAVFEAYEPHGDVYAAISPWVATRRGCGVPVVPYVVHLPDESGSLRTDLGIPSGATVIGRHGAFGSFNIEFAKDVVKEALRRREDLWFVFLNTERFVEHERARFLPRTADPNEKVRFINTCDGMLHAREEGETFGLAVAEFSVRNKRVITYGQSFDRFHIETLGDRGIYYDSPASLLEILLDFRGRPGDWDAYSARFNPEHVMSEFSQVFLNASA